MNSGIIATRYATALWKLVLKDGKAENVYSQACTVLKAFSAIQAFEKAISHPHVAAITKKLNLLESCVAPETLEQDIAKLAMLMNKNGRIAHFRLALLDFINIYRDARGIKMVRITTATEDESVLDAAGNIDDGRPAGQVIVTHKVDPSIIGGFIYESWGKRLDCSIKGSLERAREQLIEKNKRLV